MYYKYINKYLPKYIFKEKYLPKYIYIYLGINTTFPYQKVKVELLFSLSVHQDVILFVLIPILCIYLYQSYEN